MLVDQTSGPSPRPRRTPNRWVLIALGLSLVAFGALGTWSWLQAPSSAVTASAAPPGPARPLPVTIPELQAHLRRQPTDWRAWSALGSAYVDEARTTGNPSLYPKAEGSLARSLELEAEDNDQALAGRGALANARHDFAEGLEWAGRAVAVNPRNASALAVYADALVELGRYPEAFEAVQRLVGTAPGGASYARASYVRELQGDLPGATRFFELALQSAQGPSDAAFANAYLGELAWNGNDLDAAEAAFTRAVNLDPGFPLPAAGLARIAWARGDLAGATQRFEDLVEGFPVPAYIAELGDLYATNGQPDAAARQYDLVQAQQRLFKVNGVNTDLELSLFNADHGLDLEGGLAAARAEWKRRHSVFVADALAWQLHANGRDEEAIQYADKALRLGTKNPLFLFHRGMINRELGCSDAARRDLEAALALNPRFSILHAGAAADTLAQLTAAPGGPR